MSAQIDDDPDVCLAHAADASGLKHVPDGVARPKCADEVVDLLRRAASEALAVTPAGAQTSTTGASVAESGVLLSMRGMDRILDVDRSARTIRVEAGALLGDVKRAVAAEGLLLAPDPTSEQECTVGGAIACNASGARTLKYGPMRQHVRAVTVVLASGEAVEFRRSAMEKNTAGYFFAHEPVDWFVGSEGTLGVIVSAELALVPLPEQVFGVAVPFGTESKALEFVVAARTARDDRMSPLLDPRCLEYFDERALEIARVSGNGTALSGTASAMVYLEQETIGDSTDAALEQWLAMAERHGALDDLRVFSSEAELRHARAMRHSVPATMNERGSRYHDAGGRKVSTDWAVPYRRLPEAIISSRTMAADAGIDQAVTYGHAGNGHPHQNYLALDAEHLVQIEGVIEKTLRMVMQMGGTVAAEHGIGKLKRRWLPLQMSPTTIGVMRAVKRELDPQGVLAPGNMF
ncbi:MAG: FAD-binding oxidoreductase [Gemmatimonadaceae bacterium]